MMAAQFTPGREAGGHENAREDGAQAHIRATKPVVTLEEVECFPLPSPLPVRTTPPAGEMRLSVLATPIAEGGEVRPINPCLGVDIAMAGRAPGDELLRIDVSAYDDPATRLLLGFRLLGDFLPTFEDGREYFAIIHDLENSGVIRAIVPWDADDFGLLRQGESPAVPELGRLTEAGGVHNPAGGGAA